MVSLEISWNRNTDLKLTPEMTFADLRVRFGTFHYQTIKSPHRENKTVTRNGKMTKLGDIEESVWCRLVKELITREGEDELYSHLREWCKSFTWLHTQKEVEMEALELHAARIFDDEVWCDFVPFNEKYRPATLEEVEFISIINECCNKPGRVTAKELKQAYAGTTRCPHCGRHSEFKIYLGENENGENRKQS